MYKHYKVVNLVKHKWTKNIRHPFLCKVFLWIKKSIAKINQLLKCETIKKRPDYTNN